jgi:flagellar biosynthesis GTPase FlhF
MTETKQPQKGRIFISYRRVDTSYAAGRIYDRLVAKFGEDAIFMDVDTIEGGTDFIKVLEDAVQSCDVLIALIGKQWLTIKDKGGKLRLNNPEDFVRIEIATALKRNIRVIPVLVDGVDMPQPNELPENLKALARRNALQVNHHSFNPDVYRLIEHTKSALNEAEESRVMKVQALQAAREKAEREVAEKLAQEKAWLEAEEQTRQKATKEEVERARREKEQVALEEKTRQKAEEKARLDAEGQEHKRVAREKAEQKATQEREKRDAAEKAKRERAERQVALITTLKETFSNFFIFLKSFLPKAIPFLRIAGFVGIGIGVLWIVFTRNSKTFSILFGSKPHNHGYIYIFSFNFNKNTNNILYTNLTAHENQYSNCDTNFYTYSHRQFSFTRRF